MTCSALCCVLPSAWEKTKSLLSLRKGEFLLPEPLVTGHFWAIRWPSGFGLSQRALTVLEGIILYQSWLHHYSFEYHEIPQKINQANHWLALWQRQVAAGVVQPWLELYPVILESPAQDIALLMPLQCWDLPLLVKISFHLGLQSPLTLLLKSF